MQKAKTRQTIRKFRLSAPKKSQGMWQNIFQIVVNPKPMAGKDMIKPMVNQATYYWFSSCRKALHNSQSIGKSQNAQPISLCRRTLPESRLKVISWPTPEQERPSTKVVHLEISQLLLGRNGLEFDIIWVFKQWAAKGHVSGSQACLWKAVMVRRQGRQQGVRIGQKKDLQRTTVKDYIVSCLKYLSETSGS